MHKDYYNSIPFEKIERIGQRSLLYSDIFCVSWLLGRFCNYRCSYCWPHGRSEKRDFRPTELIIKTLDEIKSQARSRGFNSFHFSFSGGEPTLHPGYLDIIRHYAQDAVNTNFQSIHMTTNMSLGLEWFKRYVEASKNLHRVSITASWHAEFAEREEFVKKLLFCRDNDINITINIVMIPDSFEKLYKDALFFNEQGLCVMLKPQSDPTASYVVRTYTDEMLNKMRAGLPDIKTEISPSVRPKRKKAGHDPAMGTEYADMQVELLDTAGKAWYLDQAERFNAFDYNRFPGWLCSAGYRSIVIREPDGAIKRSYSCHDEPLGYMDKSFKLFEDVRACITPTCVSSADSKIPKKIKNCTKDLWTK